jgi:hypothetical protein
MHIECKQNLSLQEGFLREKKIILAAAVAPSTGGNH